MASENFISLKEAAKISGYHPDYLSALIRQNKLAGQKIGKTWMTTEEAVKKYLATKQFVGIVDLLKAYHKKIALALTVCSVLIAVLIGLVAYKNHFLAPQENRIVSGESGDKNLLKEQDFSEAKVSTYLLGDNGEVEIAAAPK